MNAIGSSVSALGTAYEAGTGSASAGAPSGVRALVAGDAPVRADSATISSAARARAGGWGAALDSLQSLLGRFKAAHSSAPGTRKEVQGILSSVRGVAAGGPIHNTPAPFRVSDIADGVERFRVVGANLRPGESASFEVTVTQSAQVGALLLSFGGLSLDLAGVGTSDPEARFVIEVRGADGGRELSFSSGTTLAQMVDTINTFTEVTGVRASVQGTGVRLESSQYGSDAFASVQVLEDGGAVGDGVYVYRADDNFMVDPAAGEVSFENAINRVTEFGQTLRAIMDGVEYEGVGLRLRSTQSSIDAIVLLEQWRAQTLGTFRAATVSAPGVSGPGAGGANGAARVDVVG